jgi:hypothetical protein
MSHIYLCVGRCIYCDADDVKLTDEHIIPLGLYSPGILPKASCPKCAVVTSRIEGKVLRSEFGSIRLHLEKIGMPVSSKKLKKRKGRNPPYIETVRAACRWHKNAPYCSLDRFAVGLYGPNTTSSPPNGLFAAYENFHISIQTNR